MYLGLHYIVEGSTLYCGRESFEKKTLTKTQIRHILLSTSTQPTHEHLKKNENSSVEKLGDDIFKRYRGTTPKEIIQSNQTC